VDCLVIKTRLLTLLERLESPVCNPRVKELPRTASPTYKCILFWHLLNPVWYEKVERYQNPGAHGAKTLERKGFLALPEHEQYEM
jgi:hypothetical protein